MKESVCTIQMSVRVADFFRFFFFFRVFFPCSRFRVSLLFPVPRCLQMSPVAGGRCVQVTEDDVHEDDVHDDRVWRMWCQSLLVLVLETLSLPPPLHSTHPSPGTRGARVVVNTSAGRQPGPAAGRMESKATGTMRQSSSRPRVTRCLDDAGLCFNNHP